MENKYPHGTFSNARFWVYINGGPVKLTLKHGQRLEHMTGGPAEEGWFSEWHAWEFEPEDYDRPCVTREWSEESQDCDGRHGRSGIDICDLRELTGGYEPGYTDLERWEDPTTWDGVIWPKWERYRDHGVYDQFAQEAGY